ncbi:MFS transporter [Streptococcus merionis]|uniref:MFS transporter n=2 Tax=Streptococcus merionis TaxID=400065 RepID=A0A239SSN7_9STRE|nr:MFS transporter [Streptococcus merionis]
MNIFFKNKDYRTMLINQWISSFGDTIFYLALINYVSPYAFAPLAVLCITISETVPQILQVFTGALADFQNNRIKKYTVIAGIKFALYALLTIIIGSSEFNLFTVFVICSINIISDTLSYFAGAMITPIYIRVIDEDMTSAMGFRQATANTVNVLSNTVGALLIGILSIEAFVAVNALTFLIALLGILTIKNHLMEVEESIDVVHKKTSIKSLVNHIKTSLLALKQYPVIIELLLISVFSQVILSSLLPMATLLLLDSPFYSLETAQSIAILSIFLFLGSVLGNLLSGSYLKTFSTRLTLFIGQLTRLAIVLGFFYESYLVVLVSSLFCAVTVGVVSPRISKYMFTLIPENMIGTVQSGLAAVSLVIPGVITMGIIGVASTVGFKSASVALLIIIMVVFFILNRTKDLD